MNPFLVAAAVVVVLPVLWWCSSGQRLAMCDGDLVITQYWLGGERVLGRLDGRGGLWWLVRPNGTSELYDWHQAPAIVSPKLSPPR